MRRTQVSTTPPAADAASAAPVLSRRRKWAFRLVALTLALFPFVVGELICRHYGYGGYPPVLRVLGQAAGTAWVGSNQAGLSTFFVQKLTAPGTMEEQVFTLHKPPNTVRIFAVGESAMRGFPQPPTLAASAFFRAMLADLWPERKVEVLNLGTTAIASFPVMLILEEALQFEPDLIIVYTGNNEFYGAHGVASVHAFGQSTRVMEFIRWARRSALVQWVTGAQDRPPPEQNAASDRRTLMERVIADQSIPPDDRRRGAAARNLENHLTRMVAQCRARYVPIILCTLPANERDLAPIGAAAAPSLPPEQRSTFDRLLAEGAKGADTDPSTALDALTAAAALYDGHAALHYAKGRCLTALERHEEARTEYARAKDLDPMPWRAPAALSEVVRRVAPQGATVCDLERVFQAASPGGAIGWELMDDHVHPTVRGQALIAESWLRAMAELPPPLHLEPAAVGQLPPWETYAARLGDNLVDRYGVAQRMVALFQAPFYLKHNAPALQRFEVRCAELEAQMLPAERTAARSWQDPNFHRGGLRPITAVVGEALMAAGEYARADELLSLARRQVPRFSVWNLELTWKALQCRKHVRRTPEPDDLALAREIVEHGEFFIELTRTASPPVHRYLGLAYNALGGHEPAVPHLGEALRYLDELEGLEVVQALVDSLVQTNRADRARQLLQTPVKNPVVRDVCQQLLRQLDTESP